MTTAICVMKSKRWATFSFIANSRAYFGQISNQGGTQKNSQKINFKLKDIVYAYDFKAGNVLIS